MLPVELIKQLNAKADKLQQELNESRMENDKLRNLLDGHQWRLMSMTTKRSDWKSMFGHIVAGLVAKHGLSRITEERETLLDEAADATDAAVAVMLENVPNEEDMDDYFPENGCEPDAPELQRLRESTMEGYLRQYRELLECKDTTDEVAIEELRKTLEFNREQQTEIAKLLGTTSGLLERLNRFLKLLGCEYNSDDVALEELTRLVTTAGAGETSQLQARVEFAERERDEAIKYCSELRYDRDQLVTEVAKLKEYEGSTMKIACDVRDDMVERAIRAEAALSEESQLRVAAESRIRELERELVEVSSVHRGIFG
jgi:hypothetical protein